MRTSEAGILKFIADADAKVTFARLREFFKIKSRANTQDLKRLVAGLIQRGSLCYTSHFGSSFLEISYARPIAVSERVVIKPVGCTANVAPEQRVVTLSRGASFGGGEHPTTRLAIQLIDAVLSLPGCRQRTQTLRAIDIGTGSGILAIVAAKFGIGFVCGVDTDPCAVFEACENLHLNDVQKNVVVIEGDLNAAEGVYDVALANLRSPTLLAIRDTLQKMISPESILIFSGLKAEEIGQIREFYKQVGFFVCHKRSENGWSAICLTRGAWPVAELRHMAEH